MSKRQPAQIYSFLLSLWLSVTNPKIPRCCCSICNLSCAHNCNLQNPTTELSVCVICHTKNRKILGACCYTNNNPLLFSNQSYISLKTYIHHTILIGLSYFLPFMELQHGFIISFKIWFSISSGFDPFKIKVTFINITWVIIACIVTDFFT